MEAHLEFRIPEEDYDALRLILDCSLDAMTFQRACGGDEGVIAAMIAVPLANGEFVRFTTDDWADTKDFAIDCFRMRLPFSFSPTLHQ